MRHAHTVRPLARLVVIAKECTPGRAKTRLVPPLTPREAADVAAASLDQTMAVVRDVEVAERILLFRGDPAGLDLGGFRVVPQVPGTLDQRIGAIFDDSPRGALLIGMDTPQVQGEMLQEVVDDLHSDSWFGPAVDGGFWALGMRAPLGGLVRGVPMSTPRTGFDQLVRLRAAGLSPLLLPALRDVDRIEDAFDVASRLPDTRFADLVQATLARAGDS